MNGGIEAVQLRYTTGEQVEVGDRIEWNPLFGRSRRGVVSYIPARSAATLPATEEPEHWSWDLDDGSRMLQIYIPEELQPSRRMRFVERGSPPTTVPDHNPLLDLDEAENYTTGMDFVKLMAVVVPVGLALVLLFVYLQNR